MTADAPAPAVDASTVILVRHGEPVGTAWQCFMVRRHIRSDFASDVYVFPGGKVDEADRDERLVQYVDAHPHPEEQDGASAARQRGLQVAAIRELFEEAGVLLARTGEGAFVRFDGEDGPRFEAYQEALGRRELTMLDLVTQEGLRLAADALHPFSRWITPEPLPKRFDTRFFVAYIPPHQTPLHDPRETTAGTWISPSVALERYQNGEFPLVFATERHLDRLARYPSIEGMVAETALANLQPVMPKIIERDGRQAFLLPWEEGYAEA